MIFNSFEQKISDLVDHVEPCVMCVDYGTHKKGIAISDTSLRFASPLCILSSDADIVSLFKKQRCKTLVIGYPFVTSTYATSPEKKICGLIDCFVSTFQQKNQDVSCIYVDENFSTLQVRSDLGIRGGGKIVDASVACFLLQNFLNDLENCKKYLNK
jgi:RNase H-fold protein (predicted Holliday junction resolvase)